MGSHEADIFLDLGHLSSAVSFLPICCVVPGVCIELFGPHNQQKNKHKKLHGLLAILGYLSIEKQMD